VFDSIHRLGLLLSLAGSSSYRALALGLAFRPIRRSSPPDPRLPILGLPFGLTLSFALSPSRPPSLAPQPFHL